MNPDTVVRMRKTRRVDVSELEQLMTPRTSPVEEIETAPGRFEQRRGPCRTYCRTVELIDRADGGEAYVDHTIELRVDMPVWHPLLGNAAALHILEGTGGRESRIFSKVFDRRVVHDIGILTFVAVVLGYLAALVSQTNTYVRTDLGLTKGEMGSILAWIRVSGLVAFPVAWMADRVGRRLMLLWGPPAAIVAVAVSGLAQTPVQFVLAQIIGRGLTIGLAVVMGIAAIEIVPARSRATVTSLLAFSAGPGASTVLILLFVADKSPSSWRWLYLIPLLFAVPLIMVVRKFAETPRHAALEGKKPDLTPAESRLLRRRMAIIGSAGFLTNVFAAPYANGFNDHLRIDRGFSGPQIGLFQSITNMPYSVGVALGGGWLERWGRRKVGGAAAFGSAIANSVQFLFSGALFWIVSACGSFLAGPLLPVLGVVGAESFPTASRGRTNGILTLTALAGSAVGLQVGGVLSDHIGFPRAMVALAIAPLLMSIIVRFWYPDGTGIELHDFNPGEIGHTSGIATTTEFGVPGQGATPGAAQA